MSPRSTPAPAAPGGPGFLVSSAFGPFGQGPLRIEQLFTTDAALLAGSIFFLAGS